MADYKIFLPQTEEEWLNIRKDGLGSSDIGTILGTNHFCTPVQLFEIRTGKREPEAPNLAMRCGHYMEEGVVKEFAIQNDIVIDERSFGNLIAIDTAKPFLRVSPDRLFWFKDEEQIPENWKILECKFSSMPMSENNIPPSYFAQVQYQLGVMRLKTAYLAWISFAGGHLETGFVQIDFNQAYYDFIVTKATDFWDRLKNEVYPDPITNQDCSVVFSKSEKDKEIVADDGIIRTLDAMKKQQVTYDDLKVEIDAYKVVVKKFMNDAQILKDNEGNVLATYRGEKNRMLKLR